MSEIWKYPLAVEDEQTVAMPQGAELLHVAEQHGRLVLWARVIPNAGLPEVDRVILIRGTGHPIWTQPYVGTVVTEGGALVWHVFDGGEGMSDRSAVSVLSPGRCVEQRLFFDAETGERGDCLKCCFATLLGLGYDDVPHFASMGDRWWVEMTNWLASKSRCPRSCSAR